MNPPRETVSVVISDVGPSAKKHNTTYCKQWVERSAPVVDSTFVVAPTVVQTNDGDSVFDLTSVSHQKPKTPTNKFPPGNNTQPLDVHKTIFV